MSDSRQLKPYAASDMLWRSMLEVDHAGHTWTIDANFFDWDWKIALYRNGILNETQSSPARFQLGDGVVIEAKMGYFGMQRLHLIDGDKETMMTPVEGSAEAIRARFERDHPTASKYISAFSWTVLVIGLILMIPGLIELASHIFDFEFESPLRLPGRLSTMLSVAGVIAGIERGLRFKANRWLDS